MEPEEIKLRPDSRYSSDFVENGVLGEGGFGAVFLCTRKLDKKDYALKRVLYNKDNREKAIREVVILAKLEHPRVIQYYQGWEEPLQEPCKNEDPDEEPTTHALFIQLKVYPLTLSKLLEEKMEKEIALKYCQQILQGVRYMHSQGVIHRDLSPQNIFLDSEKNIIIGDLGLAIHCDGDSVEERTPSMGNPYYCAPEMQQKPPQISPKVDIYSMGLIFFELLHHHGSGHERCENLEKLRKSGVLPKDWKHTEYTKLIKDMVQLPKLRPTANMIVFELGGIKGKKRSFQVKSSNFQGKRRCFHGKTLIEVDCHDKRRRWSAGSLPIFEELDSTD